MTGKAPCYKKILLQARAFNFLTPAEQTFRQFQDLNSVFRDATLFVTAPSITAYVVWVLADAVRTGINTLYFLARDGLVMYRIANALTKAWQLNITCRYLYVSRFSLRAPLYIIDKKYAIEKSCQYLFGTTFSDVLSRLGIEGENAGNIAQSLNMDPDKRLTRLQLDQLARKLKSSEEFDQLAASIACGKMESVIGYLRQEIGDIGFCSGVNQTFAIVDTGWVGSVHKCLSLLLGAPILGYYFGMDKIEDPACGEYRCFLFQATRRFRKYGWFCANLFECLCAADHGMTTGYAWYNGKWTPILANIDTPDEGIIWDAIIQMDICESYAWSFSEINAFSTAENEIPVIAKLLYNFMVRPSYEEAHLFGAIPFSHMTNADAYPLAHELDKQEIKQNSLTGRILNIIRGKRGKTQQKTPVYWPHGAIRLSHVSATKRIDMLLLPVVYRLLKGSNR